MTDEPTPPTEAEKLLASRQAVYGDRPDQMRRTAKIWSGLTGFDIQPWMIPMMMSAYKMLRAFNAPDYSDNVDDVDGWMVMFREQMAADGMPIIQARTVEEYLDKKHPTPGPSLPLMPEVAALYARELQFDPNKKLTPIVTDSIDESTAMFGHEAVTKKIDEHSAHVPGQKEGHIMDQWLRSKAEDSGVPHANWNQCENYEPHEAHEYSQVFPLTGERTVRCPGVEGKE